MYVGDHKVRFSPYIFTFDCTFRSRTGITRLMGKQRCRPRESLRVPLLQSEK